MVLSESILTLAAALRGTTRALAAIVVVSGPRTGELPGDALQP